MKALLTLLLLSLPVIPVMALDVHSPDSRITFSVDTDDDGVPRYSISYSGEPVVHESRLGLRFAGHAAFDTSLRIARSERSSGNGTWQQPWGERRRVHDHYNELFVLLQADAPARQVGLRVRVYDDGVGFRYELPEQRGYADVDIVDELTEFHVAPDATAWWIPGRGWNRYEFLYNETPVSDIGLAHTPVTVRLENGLHLSFHEAALVDYAAYVIDKRRGGILKTNLTPWSDGSRVRTRVPFVTPWRTIQVSPDAKGLLNSDLILNLNEPNKLGDVSWVEPGKYVGIWWGMHLQDKTWGSGPDHGATTVSTACSSRDGIPAGTATGRRMAQCSASRRRIRISTSRASRVTHVRKACGWSDTTRPRVTSATTSGRWALRSTSTSPSACAR